MIPKYIHYCWFGPNPLPPENQRYLDSWRQYMPDYEIKLWNEENFDISAYPYAQAAYQAGKYAFVSDVCRIHALYYEGGIYLDTDVEVLKPFDSFLENNCFAGFECGFDPYKRQIIYNAETCVLGSIAGGRFIQSILEEYQSLQFQIDHLVTINAIFNQQYRKLGIVLNNQVQTIPDVLSVYPSDYFICKNYQTGEIMLTDNSVCIHYYDGSWVDPRSPLIGIKRKILLMLSTLFGEQMTRSLVNNAKSLIKKLK